MAAEWPEVGKNCLARRPSAGNSESGMNNRLAKPGSDPALAIKSVASTPARPHVPRVKFGIGASRMGRTSAPSRLSGRARARPFALGKAWPRRLDVGAALRGCEDNPGAVG